MDRNTVSSIEHNAGIAPSAVEPEQLNSERIRQRFGDYGVRVLEQNASIRRANLFSTMDGVPTCRTYAIVRFAAQPEAEIADAHEQVLAGRSIGSTFRDSGWSVEKHTLFIGTIPASDAGADIAQLMRLDASRQLGMHVYELLLERDAKSTHYATIVELHHPDHLSRNELVALYGQEDGINEDSERTRQFVALLRSD